MRSHVPRSQRKVSSRLVSDDNRQQPVAIRVTRPYASAEEFLECPELARVHCLILDVSMPGMSGPELQRELSQSGRQMPTIFITAQVDATLRPALLAQGATECLFKPFSEAELVTALKAATGALATDHAD